MRKWYVCFEADLQKSKSDGEKLINYVNKPLLLTVSGYIAGSSADARAVAFKQPFKIGDKRINKTKTNLKQYIESLEVYNNVNRRSFQPPMTKGEKWWLPAPSSGHEDEYTMVIQPAKVDAEETPGVMAAVSTSRQAYLHLEKEKW